MRIDAASLVADGFRYESVNDQGRKNQVVLGRSGGVTGCYEHEEAHIVDAQGALFEIVSAIWHIGAGQLGVDQASRLNDVRLKLSVPSGDAPTTLHLEVTSGSLVGLAYAAGDLSVTASASVEGIVIERAADGMLTVVAVKVSARDVRVVSGSTQLAIAEAHVEKLSIVSSDAPTRVAASRVELVGVGVGGASPLDGGHIEMRDVSWQNGRFDASDIAVDNASVTYTFAPPKPAEESTEPMDGPRAMPDIPALDSLEGHISVDAKVIAAVPLLKNREVNHPLRVPIEAGSISFGDLEDNLSVLEDALLDFEVEGEELILELDVIPIVKFDNVTLVSWSLADQVDKDLAKQKRVRLRRLLQYRLPAPTKPTKKEPVNAKKKGIRLVGLDFASINVALSLPKPADFAIAGGTLRLGANDLPSVASLTVKGTVHAALEGDAWPGHLEIAVAGVHANVEQLAIGPVRLVRARIDIANIDPVRMELSDLSPTRLTGTVQQARIRDLTLELVPSTS